MNSTQSKFTELYGPTDLEEFIEMIVYLNLNRIDITKHIGILTPDEKRKAILYLKFSLSGEYLDVLNQIQKTI